MKIVLRHVRNVIERVYEESEDANRIHPNSHEQVDEDQVDEDHDIEIKDIESSMKDEDQSIR